MQQAMAQTVQQQVQQPVDKTINISPPMSSSLQQLAGQGMQAPLGQQVQGGGGGDFAPVGF